MHRVVRGHLGDFAESFEVHREEDRLFEAFVNYIAFRSYSADQINPEDLIYDGADPGIDGVLVFLDDQYVSSEEEISETLKKRKRDTTATVVFTQAKTGESWVKSQINNFESAVGDFLGESPSYPHSEYMQNAHNVFNALITHVGKLRNGKPNVVANFATTAQSPSDIAEIAAARSALEKRLKDSGLFHDVQVNLLSRDDILKLWASASGSVEVTLATNGMAAFPKSPKIEEGYVVTARAKDFIESVLEDEGGKLRSTIFDENVRAYIGEDNDVNEEIINTVLDEERQKRFGVLNNGITIISPDVRVQGNEVFFRDFQIVNGCQTSNVLFSMRDRVTEDASLMLKIIETDDAGLIDEIVRSTNRQSVVQDEQFLATLNATKAIERYFNVRGDEEEHRLFFERRKNQFAGEDVKAIRVFDIREIARAAGSMFVDRPDLASRYPNRLTGEMRDSVFAGNFKEEIYYCAAYALYRTQILTSNNRIDRGFNKFRWHILMAAKYYVGGSSSPSLSSNKIKPLCEKIEALFESDDAQIDRLDELCNFVIPDKNVSRDDLRNVSFVQAVKERALKFHRKKMLSK